MTTLPDLTPDSPPADILVYADWLEEEVGRDKCELMFKRLCGKEA